MKLVASDAHTAKWHSTMVVFKATACAVAAALGIATLSNAAEAVKKADKPAVTHPVKKPVARVTASRAEIKSIAAQTALGVRVAEAALSPAELAIAQLIHVGQVACELGVTINIKADVNRPGYFDLESKKFKFRMFPVVSSTGAIRLQDAQAGAVWLQLANKSMLMSQKLGSRLADVCMNPAQMVVAAEMEKNPPSSLLEPVKAAAPIAPVPPPQPDKAAAQSAPVGLQQSEKALVLVTPVAPASAVVSPVAIQ